ncbi:MAG: 2-oxoacid:acceptor oxidoreductase family protein [Anaerolineales bacterium]|nr:2-oxoacid:acceptor oxidoreductase family protein [Anaerolineales bacterium]MCX7755970.1 2-oxoacid:acceptor oxidoreductase family protein [Anaerolineales bacterium]MDW8277086.1 2-oxoacid:acceptor oxidoreductase family protein [Anaerolineales bacterium]
MQKEIIIAGFGGQGVLFAGQVLAYAAMDLGKEVTWIPSYGPEMRGGTANCTVVIADEEIGSPLVKRPPFAIALNLPSFDKYEPLMQPGGVLVVNQSMVDRGPKRSDIQVILVPANEIAEEIGNKKLTNMVTVGALVAAMPELLTLEAVEEALRGHLPARHQHLLPQNFQALRRGYETAREQMATV